MLLGQCKVIHDRYTTCPAPAFPPLKSVFLSNSGWHSSPGWSLLLSPTLKGELVANNRWSLPNLSRTHTIFALAFWVSVKWFSYRNLNSCVSRSQIVPAHSILWRWVFRAPVICWLLWLNVTKLFSFEQALKMPLTHFHLTFKYSFISKALETQPLVGRLYGALSLYIGDASAVA